MSTNLPARFVTNFSMGIERFRDNPARGSIIGRMDLRRYYAVKGSAPSDVAIVSLRGKPDEPAYQRKGGVQYDSALHGRITADHGTPMGEDLWHLWILKEGAYVTKGKAPKPAPVPEPITLDDVVTTAKRVRAGAPVAPSWAPPDSPELRAAIERCKEGADAATIKVLDSADYPSEYSLPFGTMVPYITPKLSDVVKDDKRTADEHAWYVTTRRDMGYFPSRDKARAAVRALKA